MRAFLLGFAHSNLLIGGVAAIGAWVCQLLLGLPPHPLPPLIAALVFFSIYALDRLAGKEADRVNHAGRTSFLGRHTKLLTWMAAASYLAALGLALIHGWRMVLIALLPLVAVLLYSFSFLPPGVARWVGFSRLKEVPVIKNVVVAGTWATTVVGLSLAAAHAPLTGAAVAAWLFFFLRWGINSVVFDIRDVEGDRANGIRTLPVMLGLARTRGLLQVLNVVLAVLLGGTFALGIGPPLFAALNVSSLYGLFYVAWAARTRDLHFFCDVLVDGGEWLLIGVTALLVCG